MCVCRMGIENRAEIFSHFFSTCANFLKFIDPCNIRNDVDVYQSVCPWTSSCCRRRFSCGAASGTAWRDAVALEGATTLTIACSSGSSILRALQRSPLGSSSSPPSCSWPWTFLSLPHPPTTTLPRTRYAAAKYKVPATSLTGRPDSLPVANALLSSLRERGWSLTLVMECTDCWHLYFVCSPTVISALFWYRFTVLLNSNTQLTNMSDECGRNAVLRSGINHFC